MLIDFTVENYRSISTAVTLSAIAQNRPSRAVAHGGRESAVEESVVGEPFEVHGRSIRLLPVIGIFGANASGKSNVIHALDEIFKLVFYGSRENSGLENFLTPIVPFKLDGNSRTLPTRFRIRIAVSSGIYDYSLSIHKNIVLKEELKQIPPPPRRMQSRVLFSRHWNSVSEVHVWRNGKAFTNKYKDIQKATKQDEPFLHLCVRRLEIPAISDLAAFFIAKWPGVTLGTEYFDHLTAIKMAQRRKDLYKAAVRLLKLLDTGIADLQIRERRNDSSAEPVHELWVLHKTAKSDIWWPFTEESIGTQRLFALIMKVLHIFDKGGLICVDELSPNIHPHIIRIIINLFQSSKTNPKRAQLIFTSHDYTLQKPNLLRRDQIWFTQKREDGSTELYPLSDFHPRNDLALDKAYMEGRFGAVPILPEPEALIVRR
ncbi:MAG TPA: ATP-binding protein [Pyrinomonadaceae bacterium]|nr:ATP-binding protein [Pyrinomonadaceae bacterium]